MALIEKLSAIGNAIRAKTGKEDLLTLEQMPGEISGISGSGYSYEDIATRVNISGDVVLEGTEILDYAFANSAITSIVGENVINCYQGAFNKCTQLKSVRLPKVTTFYGRNAVFTDCTALESIEFNEMTVVSTMMFMNCTSLKRVVLPKAHTLYAQAFNKCSSLEYVEFGVKVAFCRSIEFSDCTALVALVLRGDTLSTMASTSCLNKTPIAEGAGYIYVPSALLEEYKAATNWSVYADQFRAIEGSEYE